MTPPSRYAPPTAQEIERRFRNPAVIVTRPLILGSIGLLQSARCFGWKAAGLENIDRLELPLILAANHQSHADTAAILGTLPRRIRDRTAVAAALDVFGRPGNGSLPSPRVSTPSRSIATDRRCGRYERRLTSSARAGAC